VGLAAAMGGTASIEKAARERRTPKWTRDDLKSMNEFKFFEIFGSRVVIREKSSEKKRISPFFS
jgi:hypothetical protein